MNKSTFLLLSSLMCLCSISLSAQEPVPTTESEASVVETDVTRKAEALSQIDVDSPDELRVFGQEAWVQVGFIIDKSGSVKEPIIEGSVGGIKFEEAAIKALENLIFKPALYKGSPVEESISGVFIPFLFDQTMEGADANFISTYNELTALYRSKQLTEADDALATLSKAQDLTITEISMLEVTRGYSAILKNDPYKQIEHFRNASVNFGAYLPIELLGSVLQTRIALAARMSLFDEAQKSFALLELVDPANEKLTRLAMMIAPIQKTIELGQLVQVHGTISERGYWTYQPVRRNFSFATVDAGTKELELRCEIKNQRFAANTDNEWKIPKSWGICSIVIYGEPGSKFSLLEFSDIQE